MCLIHSQLKKSNEHVNFQGPYIVLCLLECIDIGVNSMNNVACIIRQHCISSLLAEGEWACAVFVAMQIEDPQVRLVAVKPILLVSFKIIFECLLVVF